jgi:hypothetical protein
MVLMGRIKQEGSAWNLSQVIAVMQRWLHHTGIALAERPEGVYGTPLMVLRLFGEEGQVVLSAHLDGGPVVPGNAWPEIGR